MIPEIEVTCRGERLFINSVTVEQYKKYISLMEKNDTEKFSGVMFFNKKIMQEMFGNELSLAAVGGLILYDTIQEKNPELCGFTAEEFDKEENK